MKTIKKIMLGLAAVVGFTTAALAATPAVVWEGDFGTSTKVGTDNKTYTLTLNQGTVNANGFIVNPASPAATDKAARITWPQTADTDGMKSTVLIRYSSLSNLAADKSFGAFHTSKSTGTDYFDLGLFTYSDSGTIKCKGYYCGVQSSTAKSGYSYTFNEGTSPTPTAGSGVAMLILDNRQNQTDAGCGMFCGSTVANLTGGRHKGLRFDAFYTDGVSLCGPYDDTTKQIIPGVVIEAVAIFPRQFLTANDVASFKWPSETSLSKMYSNRLSTGDVVVPNGVYGAITVPGKGYKATKFTTLTKLSNTASGEEVTGSYADIIKSGTQIESHTVAGWFNVGELPTGDNLKTIYLAKSCDLSDNGYKVVVNAAGKILVGKTNYNGGNYTWNGTPKSTVNAVLTAETAGNWFHLAVANSYASGKVLTPTIYINGEVVAVESGTFPCNLNGSSCTDLMIGAGISAAGVYVDTNTIVYPSLVVTAATTYVLPKETTYTLDMTQNESVSTAGWDPEKTGAFLSVDTLDVTNKADTAVTLTFDENTAVKKIMATSEAGKDLTLAKGDNVTVSASEGFDFSSALGKTTVNFATGSATIKPGGNTVLTQAPTVGIEVGTGKKLTLGWSSETAFTQAITGAGAVDVAGSILLNVNNQSQKWVLTVKDGGTLKMGGGNVLPSNTATVDAGGTLDVNFKKDNGNLSATLNGGKLTNTSSPLTTGSCAMKSLTLTADSEMEFGSSHDWGLIGSSYAATAITLNGHTLTKTGAGTFFLINTTVSSTSAGGNVCVDGGTLDIGNQGTGSTFGDNVTLTVNNGGTLSIASGKKLTLQNLTVNGGTISNSGTLTGLAVLNGTVNFNNIGGTIGFANAVTVASGTTTLSTAAVTALSGKTVSVGADGILDIRTTRSGVPLASIAEGGKLSVKQAASGETQTITISGTSLADGDYASKVQVCEKDDDTTLLPIKTAVVSGGTLTITLESTIFEVNVTEAKTISEIEVMALGEGKTFEQSAQLTIQASNNPVITVDKSLHITKFAITGQATLKFNSGCTITAPTISATDAVVLDCSSIAAGEVNVLVGTISDTTKFSATGVSESQSVEITETGVKAYIKDTLTRNNPVTGEAGAQTYTHAFLGSEDGDWTKPANWRSKNADNVLKAYSGTYYPQKAGGGSGDWSPALFDGNLIASEASKTVSLTTLEGWDLCLAVLNGVDVTVATLNKFQSNTTGKMFLWVGEDSSITFGSWGTGSSGGDIAFAVAAEDGITFNMSFNKGNPISYYLKGEGTVNYAAGVSAGTHTIKQLEVKVGTVEKAARTIAKQKLINLGAASSATFSAANDITATCDNVGVTPTYSATKPTVNQNVGTYSIAKEDDGVYAYVVAYSDKWDIVEPLTGTLTADTPWANIVWKDAYDHEGADLTLPHTYKVVGTTFTATQGGSVAAGSAVEVVSGTLALDTTATIGTETYTIDNGATLLVKASGLKASKVTNNGGTIKFEGGSEASPIAVTGDGDLPATLAADTHVKFDDGGTARQYNITGSGATSFYTVARNGTGNPGMANPGETRPNRFNNVIICSLSTGGDLWIEHGALDADGTVGLNVTGNIKLSDLDTPIVLRSVNGDKSLSGQAFTIKCKENANFAGTSAQAITIDVGDADAVQTFSGNYTGALTVNENAQVKLTGSAAPSSISGAGSVTIASDTGTATLTSNLANFTGTITVDANVTSVDFGANRPTNVTFESADTTVQFTELASEDGVLNVSSAFDGRTITVMGLDGVIHPLVGKKYTPSISGAATEYDFTFTNTLYSVGHNKGKLTRDTSYGLWEKTNCFNTAGNALFTAADVYLDNPGYPTEWSASIFAKMPTVTDAVLMAFGTKTGGSIALIKGSGDNDVILARTTGNSHYQVLTTMTVPNATRTSHLYTFCKSANDIKIYLDSTLWTTYHSETAISFGNGFQMGSLHSGIGDTGFKQYGRDYWDPEVEANNSTVTILRIFTRVIGPNTVKALSDAYPYHSPFGTYARNVTADSDWVSTDAWSKEGEETKYEQPAANASVKLNNTGDAAVTLKFNRAENVEYEGLTLSGDHAITIAANDAAPKGGKIGITGLVAIGCDVTNKFEAIDIAGSPLSVSDGKTLTIDFSCFDLSTYYTNAEYTATGTPNLGAGAKVEAVLPTAVAGRTATFAVDPSTGCYKLTITMDGPITGTVNKTGTWGDTGVITWRAGEVEIAEPNWSVLNSATLVVAEGNDYTLTYPDKTVPNAIAKAGTGTLGIYQGNNGKDYVVDAGTLKFTSKKDNGAANITVNANGTFDLNGGSGGDPNLAVTLNGGKLANNGTTDMGVGKRQFSAITLTADSTVGGTKALCFTSSGFAANTLQLNGHKLSKVDGNTFGLCNTTVNNGTLAVEAGTLEFARNASTFNDNATLIVADTATLQTSITQGDPAAQTFGGTMSRWSSVTGSVVVADGALQIGNNNNKQGGVTAGEYKFGKSITVNSGKTLRLWIWATRDQTFNRNTKAVLTTPVTLNGSTIYTQDGAYWFDSITVNGTGNTMQFNWNKSHGIGSLNGDENAALTLTRSQSESFRQYFAIDGGDFNGTLTVNNTDGGAASDFWLSPKGTVLADATVLCQGTGRPTYIVIRDDATLGEVTGDKFAGIFGDGVAAHSVTLTQGTYAAPIKDISTGTSSTYPLSVVIDGNVVAITGESAYTGTTTINNGAKLDAALGEGLPRASTITIAEGGQLVVDLENFVTVAETSEAYHFSGDLPANALDIRNQDKYPWISIGTSGEDLGKVIIDQTKLPFTGLHIVKMLPKHTSKTADRDPNGRDSGWIDIVNYGPTATNLSNYKIVRSNIGKKVKSDDKDLARLCSYTLPKGGTFRVYTSEEYETAEDFGGKGKEVAWFKTVEGVVTKLDAYEDGAIMVVPTKVNPKKFPMVRLYDYSTNTKGDVIDEVIVPCDMDDNMMLEVVANTNKLERRVVYPNGEKVECGPVVNSLYGVKDVKSDLDLMKPGKFAPAGQAYPVKIPVNPLMTGGKALDANTITGVNLIYRVFDPTTISVSNKVALTSHTITAEDPDVAKYGEGCLLWEGNIPAEAMATAGKLVQFRAEITDKGGKTWIYPNNMNPDIGYGWYGVVVEPTIIETPGTDITSTSVCTNSLQTFLMFIDDTNKAEMDKDIDDPTLKLTYGARLAIYDVPNHTYYDNVRIDRRGQTSASFYKKSHGIRFNKVAPLVAKDPFTGDKYETRKTSFIAEYGDPMYLRQTLSLRLMRESGIKAPFDWPVRLYLNGTFYQLAFHSSRFSDEAVEDFYGLNKYGYSYKNVHQLIHNGEGAEKKTPDDDNEADMTVYNEFVDRINGKTADQLTTDAMKHFNIPAWVNYLAAVKVTQEADDVWTNLGLYINKYDSFFNANGDDTMMPLAYDQNLSFGQWYYQDDRDRGRSGIVATNDLMKSHPFYGGANVLYHYADSSTQPKYNRGMEAILQNAQFREMLSRRLRTLAEQYLGAQDATKDKTPIWKWVVAYTNAIAGDVAIDRTKWDYENQVIKTASNIWVWETALPFDDGVEDLWANYIVPRRKHLYDTHAAENAGKTGYPAAGGGYATGSSALIPETQAATETFGKRGALYFTDLNGKKPGEDGFDITTDKILGICNTNNVAIDMSYWTVEGAVVATLKPGTVIPANGTLWIVDDRRTASDKVVAKGLTKPIVVNLDKTLVDDDGNPIEVFTDATDQLFLKDADGTPAITHEATIGTKYYITLLDAFNCAETNDIVALLTDINNQTPAAVKTSVFLYGDTNTLTGAGFDVAEGATLTIASGQIANGALAKTGSGTIVLIGGKYTEESKTAYTGIVSNQYHMAALGLVADEDPYKFQVVPGEAPADPTTEVLLPVAEIVYDTTITNDVGNLAFTTNWIVKAGLATAEQLATKEGRKSVVDKLNTHDKNHIQVWENKVLGLDGAVEGNIPVILPKQTEDATKVTFKMANQDKVSTDSGAIVTYKVWMGSTPKGKDKGSSEAVLYTEDTAMPLPKDGVQYYMLEVITTPAK